ncbi:hypothetical protein CBL_02738 [Carabus blaptoides fortunei]
MQNNPFRGLRDNNTEQEPSLFQFEPLPYRDHVIHIEEYVLPELPLSADNVDIEESDDITPLEVGSSLSRFFGEAEDSIRKLEDYGIESIKETILEHVSEQVEHHPTFVSSKGSELSLAESSHGLFVPFSELELGNTKEYPFPEHFKRWKDTASVASSYDAEAAWEVMKGPDPPSFKTPIYLSLRNWLQRIAGITGCVVCWLVCCFC